MSNKIKIFKTLKATDTSRGFVAILASVMIASALLLMAVTLSDSTALLYDQVLHHEYRVVVREHARACLDLVIDKLSEDYFFTVSTTTEFTVSDFICDIESVVIPTSGLYRGNTAFRNISVSTEYAHVHARISAEAEIKSSRVLFSENNLGFF